MAREGYPNGSGGNEGGGDSWPPSARRGTDDPTEMETRPGGHQRRVGLKPRDDPPGYRPRRSAATPRTGWAAFAALALLAALVVAALMAATGSPAPRPPASDRLAAATPGTDAGTGSPAPTAAEASDGRTSDATAEPSTSSDDLSTAPSDDPGTGGPSGDLNEEAPPSPTETTAPPSAALEIVEPSDGEVVTSPRIEVRGTTAPGAVVTRDVPLWFDDHATADATGRWSLPVDLAPGDNQLVFRVADDHLTEQTLLVTYQPPA